MPPVARRLTVLACALPLLAAAACGSSSGAGTDAAASGSAAPSAAADCSPASLKTQKAGTLTVATDKPAYEPWFSGDDPGNGKGFESAVAYAVAEQLGYDKAAVTWATASFNSVIAPGPKNFDIDLNQVSINPARKKAVDFSSGYYDVAQTVIAMKSSKIAGAKSLADLKGAKLGAQVGTTSYTAITDQIVPTKQPAVYDTNDLAKLALKNGQIDGLVVDLPTAFYITAAELEDAAIVGQLPVGASPEQFGIVLDLGSPLTGCVTKAVDALRADGTLAALGKQYLAQAGAPELR
jgi:polar amino acid transport system substrate-binding protein